MVCYWKELKMIASKNKTKTEKVKCWKIFACKEKDCPAYKSKNLSCWLFSGTHCRDEIQGKFLEKMEMCLSCQVFDENMDVTAMNKTVKVVNKQFKEFRQIVDDRDRELEGMSMELALGLSEVFEGLKKISSGDPEVKMPETSEVELITKLKHIVNMTSKNIGEIVDQSHEFAIGLAEHFDVLHRVSKGDLNARIAGGSQVELLESLKKVTNEMITERKKAEGELHNLNRVLKTLSGCNEIVVRATEESELLNDICHIIVEIGGYCVAWVGFAERDEEKAVRPVAKAGCDEAYLDTLDITWADTERGRGPTGTAIRTGKPFIACNIPTDPDFATLHADAIKHNYASSIAIPLRDNGSVFGAVNIYSEKTDAFNGEEVSHLTELADDLAYGIMTLRTRAERKRAVEALQESEKRYRNLVENALAGVYQTNIKGDYLYVNDALAKMLEFESAQEMMSGNCRERYKNSEDRKVLIEKLQNTGKVSNFELVLLTKTGKSKNVLLSAAIEGDILSGMIRDITDLKRAQEQIQNQLERLSALRSIDMAITASLDLRVTLNVILDQVTDKLGVDAADILLLNSHSQTLQHAASRGFRTNALKHTDLRLGKGHAGRAALERRIINVTNLPEDLNFTRAPLLDTEAFISYYAIPLIAKGHVNGILEIFHRSQLQPEQDWLDFLEALASQAAIAVDNATMFDDLQKSNIELTLAYDTTLEGWSKALDLRDKETEGHTQRVTEMTLRLAKAMGMSEFELVHIRRGALLHDIGKMGIPDSILLKPGLLTEEEWGVMRFHPEYAYKMLSPISFLRPALDIPYYHHEKWDGTGYPHGLKGEHIPLPARIFAVVDVWDALDSNRSYRVAWQKEEIYEYIREQAGKHFDPKVVEVFLGMDW
jgi:PAS domain S-box-containing protein